MLRYLLSAGLVLAVSMCMAQEPATELPALKANDFFVSFGSFNEHGAFSSVSDFKKLAPSSQLLKMDLTGFDEYKDMWYGTPIVSANVGFRLRNREGSAYRKSPLLKAGFTFLRATPYSLYYSNENTTRIDTLYSQPAALTLYVDSVNYQNLDMNYRSDQLRLDFAAIFRTNPEARWSIFGGAGISFGWSFNNYTEITYSSNSYTNIRSSDETNYSYSNADENDHVYTTESYKNKGGVNGSFYLPMGIDFKIARRGEFFSRLHLFYEFRPGINFISAPETGGSTKYFIGNSLGLRVNWD